MHRWRWCLLLLCSAVIPSLALAADAPDFWNFETSPTHALDLSPDGERVALAHTASGQVHWFAWEGERLIERGSIYTCVDPSAVRFRNANELWVVCQISDSIVVLDLRKPRILRTLPTADRPADLVFAGEPQRAYVSLMREPALQVFDPAKPSAVPQRIALQMAEPRSLASDGLRVYVLSYRSGNATTVLPGGVIERSQPAYHRDVVGYPEGPASGQNPPPNAAAGFDPPLDPALPSAPATGLIVRRDAESIWRDDLGRDWSEWVSGARAPISGRAAEWNLPDNDLAIVDTRSSSVRYHSGLLTHGLALIKAGPALWIAGIEAANQRRFEPRLRARFVSHQIRRLELDQQHADAAIELNAHLDSSGVGDADPSVADARALDFDPDTQRIYLAAAGSARVLRLDANGQRVEPALLEVPAGPSALIFDRKRKRLLIWSRDASILSVVKSADWRISQSLHLPDPTPAPVALGRRWLTDARLTSANGTQSCSACHLDAHSDRLAWDLGDPAEAMQSFAGNCITDSGAACGDWHPMKGPMVTQPLTDLIGHEPFHWRGDRASLHDFARTYTGLLGRAKAPTSAELDQLRDYLASIRAQPNPFRDSEDRLPLALDLNKIAGLGLPRDKSWPPANARRGLKLFRTEILAAPFECVNCHTLPTGYAAAERIFSGGVALPAGSHGEAHLGISSLAGLSQGSFKVPGLRDLYDKLDPLTGSGARAFGVGFGADGSLLTLGEFLRLRNLHIPTAQDEADILALLLAFGGNRMPRPPTSSIREPLGPAGHNTHAAVGRSVVWKAAEPLPPQLKSLLAAARSGDVSLLAQSMDAPATVWLYVAAADRFESATGHSPLAELDRRGAGLRFIAAAPGWRRGFESTSSPQP